MTTHCLTLNAQRSAICLQWGASKVGEGQKAPNFWMTESLSLLKSSPSDRLLPLEQCACSSFHALWLSFVFALLRTFCLRPVKSLLGSLSSSPALLAQDSPDAARSASSQRHRLQPVCFSLRWQRHYRKTR